MIDFVLVFGSYLIGSLSSAVIVCKLMRLPDPRTFGSKNPGATNVLRIENGGKKAAILTLLGDMLKGVIPVLVAVQLQTTEIVIALTMLAAFFGHLYPIFFGFKGGKGVATALGTLLGLHWLIGVAALLTWLGTAFLFRYSSLAALVAILLAPGYIWFFYPADADPTTLVAAMGVITLILYWRHRSNIRNLLTGKEGKIGKKSK